jgi:hypothetical protein
VEGRRDPRNRILPLTGDDSAAAASVSQHGE